MALARYIADTSAVARMHQEPVAGRLLNLLTRGLVATTAMLDLEALFSARSPDEYEKLWAHRGSIFEYIETEDSHWQRALEVQRELASKSMHRSVKLPDLLIAAVAEAENLTLLHYDGDFEYVAEITGQAIEWIVERGSAD